MFRFEALARRFAAVMEQRSGGDYVPSSRDYRSQSVVSCDSTKTFFAVVKSVCVVR